MNEYLKNLFPSLPISSIWIIGSLSLGILGLLTYKGKEYFVAARKFQNTIRNELEGLYPTPTKWPIDPVDIVPILREKYPRLENAVHIFREYLPCFFQRGFDTAWLQYHKDYHQYLPLKGESYSYGEKISEYDNTKTYKEKFQTNVKNLLKYAKQI